MSLISSGLIVRSCLSLLFPGVEDKTLLWNLLPLAVFNSHSSRKQSTIVFSNRGNLLNHEIMRTKIMNCAKFWMLITRKKCYHRSINSTEVQLTIALVFFLTHINQFFRQSTRSHGRVLIWSCTMLIVVLLPGSVSQLLVIYQLAIESFFLSWVFSLPLARTRHHSTKYRLRHYTGSSQGPLRGPVEQSLLFPCYKMFEHMRL